MNSYFHFSKFISIVEMTQKIKIKLTTQEFCWVKNENIFLALFGIIFLYHFLRIRASIPTEQPKNQQDQNHSQDTNQNHLVPLTRILKQLIRRLNSTV